MYTMNNISTELKPVTRNGETVKTLHGYDTDASKWVQVVTPSEHAIDSLNALDLDVEHNGIQHVSVKTNNGTEMYAGTIHRFQGIIPALFDFAEHVIDCTDVQFNDDGEAFIVSPFTEPVKLPTTRNGKTQEKIDAAVSVEREKAVREMLDRVQGIVTGLTSQGKKPGEILKDLKNWGMADALTLTDIQTMAK